MRWELVAAAMLALGPLTVLSPGIATDAGADPGPPTGERVFALVMEREHFNGRTWPDTPLLEAYEGERLRFLVHTASGGGMHTFHMHGHPWEASDEARFGFIDTIRLDGGETHEFTVRAGLEAGHAGDWFYHCHVDTHFQKGMWGLLRVYPYAVQVDGTLDDLQVQLVDDGRGLEDARFEAHLRADRGPATPASVGDGEPLAVDVQERGYGAYRLAPELPADAEGQLVLTAHHEEGDSVARLDLTEDGYELARDVDPANGAEGIDLPSAPVAAGGGLAAQST